MRLAIDLSSLTFIAGSDPAGVLDMARRPRADTATGELNELCRADGLLQRAIDVAATQGNEAQELAMAAGTSVERIDRIVHAQTAAGRSARGSRFATSTDTTL